VSISPSATTPDTGTEVNDSKKENQRPPAPGSFLIAERKLVNHAEPARSNATAAGLVAHFA
jgi:hypothetical protein